MLKDYNFIVSVSFVIKKSGTIISITYSQTKHG